ncbi:MAG: hypothetical protein RMM29_00515 [Planctomycetota bacterium]|nr:LPP20 family lipoprotein [Planctomycetota bacterium]MDW8372118.1 hypothetical protein [Planctomycetota bacterium]
MHRSPLTFALVSASIAGLVVFAGCSKREEPKPVAPGIAAPTNDVPDWVNDPTQGGKVFGAYGVSERMLAGEKAMRDRAMLSARQELAAMINSKIQGVVKDWVREGGIITSQDNAQAAMTSFESAVRNVINQELQGSMQKARYVDPQTGKLYVWVVVDQAVVQKIAEQAKSAARENKELRAHMAAKIEAEKAFAELDRLIDKEMGLAK